MREETIHLLIIEDKEVDTWLIQDALINCGVALKIYSLPGGEEAIQFMTKQGMYKDMPTPDLIILDLQMPGMKGIDVLKYSKANDILKDIPVVVLTISSRPKDIKETYEFQAAAYLTKPVQKEELIRIIQHLDLFRPMKRASIS